jgi:uncharacterized RDD family membrane protein YckC
MQCPSCRAVYSNGLDICPRCKTPATKSISEAITEPPVISQDEPLAAQPAIAASVEAEEIASTTIPQVSSTLIEFPGVSRASRPQWRKELSERVREIQERRARDSEGEAEVSPAGRMEQPAGDLASPQLGLVPPQDTPAMNPIVAAALKRLERARQSSSMPRARSSMGGAAATAMARVAEEQYQPEIKPTQLQTPPPSPVPTPVPSQQAQPEKIAETKTADLVREHSLIVVPQPAPAKVSIPVSKPAAKTVTTKVLDDTRDERLDDSLSGLDYDQELYNDRAPVLKRIAGSIIDLVVVAFASSPFAAIIELTNGNWGDWRVGASMGGIFLVVMFLYLTAATALAGRTWGMSLMSLRAVDADTGLPPTTRQSVGRALLFIVSLFTLGFGILYALFDAEGRTAHDYLSGTAVVRE